jgi:hypothetical protein
MSFGVVVDPLNVHGRPDPDRLTAYEWVRVTAFDSDILYTYCQRLHEYGIKYAAVVVRETFGAWPPSREVMERIARRMSPTLWVIGNEFDAGVLPEESPSSWVQTPEEFEAMYGLVCRAIHHVSPRARCVLGGSVSGQPGVWLKYVEAVERSGLPIDGYDVHPYNKTAEEARDLLAQYQKLRPALPLYVFEWWRPWHEVAEFHAMLDETAKAHTWFCYSDGMVTGMGLYYRSFVPSPEGQAMERLIAARPPEGETTMADVGAGVLARMAEHDDHPLTEEVYAFGTQAEVDAHGYQWSQTWGTRGLYIASNHSGQWEVAGPFPAPAAG